MNFVIIVDLVGQGTLKVLMISYKPPGVLSEQVTGFVHITTQKDDIKVAKIILEVTGTLYTKVLHKRKTKKGIEREWKDNV